MSQDHPHFRPAPSFRSGRNWSTAQPVSGHRRLATDVGHKPSASREVPAVQCGAVGESSPWCHDWAASKSQGEQKEADPEPRREHKGPSGLSMSWRARAPAIAEIRGSESGPRYEVACPSTSSKRSCRSLLLVKCVVASVAPAPEAVTLNDHDQFPWICRPAFGCSGGQLRCLRSCVEARKMRWS